VAAAAAVRSVTLNLPKSGRVGTSVSGSIQVFDKTGSVSRPVSGVEVSFQEKRGNLWVSVADGVTDPTGVYLIGITSDVNSTFRAVTKTASGASLVTKPFSFSAEALVTWAARPDMDVTRGAKATYLFRVVSVGAPSGYVEYAKASAPTKWTKAKVTTSKTDVLAQSVSFPTAGTWLLRGTSVGNSATASGHTSTLTITVS
jgi:hypothetical protein